MYYMSFLIAHEISDGIDIQIPPRHNFLLKYGNSETQRPLYGVENTIHILTENKLQHHIPEFLSILSKQGVYIKQKLEERDETFCQNYSLYTRIVDGLDTIRMVKSATNRERLKRVIASTGRYTIKTIPIENLVSYRLRHTLLVTLIPVIRKLMGQLKEQRDVIVRWNEEWAKEKREVDRHDIETVETEINRIISSFYSTIIFRLPMDTQYEYVSICFRETYESDHDSIDRYITSIVNGMNRRYFEYYHSQRIMIIEDIRRPYFKQLKEGTILYRGYQKPTDPLQRRHLIPPGRPFVFFTPNPLVALGYAIPTSANKDLGEIAVYQTSRPLKLLDFSHDRTLGYVYALLHDMGAPRDVIHSMLYGWFGWEGFGNDFKGPSLSSRERIFQRKSDETADFSVVKWICSKGFNGYVALDVDGLADEIVLCDPIPIHSTTKKISSLGIINKSSINYPLPSSEKEWYQQIFS